MPQYIFVETLTVVNVNRAYAYTITKSSPLIKEMSRNSELPAKQQANTCSPKVTYQAEIVDLFSTEWENSDFFGRVGMFLLAMDNFDKAMMRATMHKLRTLHPSVSRFVHNHESDIEHYQLGSVHE